MGTIKTNLQKIIIINLLLLPLFLYGQVDSLSVIERPLPVLNNHYFSPTSAFPSPFMTTHFKTGIGGGLSLTTIPIYLNDGMIQGEIEGENTYVTADIDIQIRAKEWLAVWLRYQANARIGSSTPTILAHGVTSITAFDFGWMLRLINNKKSQLSATINITNSNVSAINLLNYIRDIVSNPDSITASITRARNPLYGGIGFRYAYAFSDLIGMQAFLNASYGESILKENRTVWKFDMGILASFNFVHRYKVPVGLNLGFMAQKFALFNDEKEDNSKSFLLKISYTGREEYNIGLELNHISTSTPLIKSKVTMDYLTTSFVMVYYF